MTQFALQNVRLSFPSLAAPAEFNGEKGKYEATFLINKETQSDLIAKVENEIKKLLADNLDSKTKKPFKIPPEKMCLKDGDYVDYDGYEGMMAIKASSKNQPDLIDSFKQPTTEYSKFYAGCYVDVILDLWFQNNKFGRRINANLYLVRFRSEGDAFGGTNTDKTLIDGLDDLTDLTDNVDSQGDEFND